MVNKLISLIILFLLSFDFLYSQNKINITGIVIDAVQNTPIDYCGLSLIDQQTKKVLDGTVCNVKGKFTITVSKPGIYIIKAEFIGYQSYTKDSILINKTDH